MIEIDVGKRRGLMLSIECINILNEVLLFYYIIRGCLRIKWLRYLSFLKSRIFVELI